MAELIFKKATQEGCYAKIFLSGPSGSGKTFSSLRLATGLAGGGNIAVIDGESGTASKYAGLFDFYTIEPQNFSPESYIKYIDIAIREGFKVVILDNISKEWQFLVEYNDQIATAKFRGNTWAAWSETTPRHRRFMEYIVAAKIHIIATARVATEWVISDDKKPEKVGTKVEQGKGIDYEFDTVFDISLKNHMAYCSKDRTHLMQDRTMVISEETGIEFLDWLKGFKDKEIPSTPSVSPSTPPAGAAGTGQNPPAGSAGPRPGQNHPPAENKPATGRKLTDKEKKEITWRLGIIADFNGEINPQEFIRKKGIENSWVAVKKFVDDYEAVHKAELTAFINGDPQPEPEMSGKLPSNPVTGSDIPPAGAAGTGQNPPAGSAGPRPGQAQNRVPVGPNSAQQPGPESQETISAEMIRQLRIDIGLEAKRNKTSYVTYCRDNGLNGWENTADGVTKALNHIKGLQLMA